MVFYTLLGLKLYYFFREPLLKHSAGINRILGMMPPTDISDMNESGVKGNKVIKEVEKLRVIKQMARELTDKLKELQEGSEEVEMN